ncbi:HEPN domain-containing protein [Sphingobacterium sp. JB170]|uniref:HEPN domain-containing protein n=1 Tax=Sphingobacterium sp. JB170 TaxID=1434842 RepID=UPI00097EC9D5|nr:HEPN domain-containing protein [Sphingobacterium sp. JB170]SJN19583.1 hypothetical protein FM107_01880 [Sphingobacterium sp. JB170]
MIQEQNILIERLTTRVDLEYAFLVPSLDSGSTQLRLLLVVNPAKGVTPNSIFTIVTRCMSDIPAIPFDVQFTGEWFNHLKRGSLYHLYCAQDSHQVFTRAETRHAVFKPKIILNLLDKGTEHYARSKACSTDFMIAADNFAATQDFSKALFMLHQFLEVRLKGFLVVAGIQGGNTHRIERLLKSAAAILPELAALVLPDNPDLALIRRLDQLYKVAHKSEHTELAVDCFDEAFRVCRKVADIIDEMVQGFLQGLDSYASILRAGLEQTQSQSVTDKQAVANAKAQLVGEDAWNIAEEFGDFPWTQDNRKDAWELVERIRKNHNPEQLTMLNYHVSSHSGPSLFASHGKTEAKGRVQLFLVAVVNNPGPFNFRMLYSGTAKAAIVFLSVSDLEQGLANADRFFNEFWTKGLVLRRKSRFRMEPASGQLDGEAEYTKTIAMWVEVEHRMRQMAQVVQRHQDKDMETATCLLSYLLEMGVRSYIRFITGYLPKNVPLASVIGWSGVINQKLNQFLASWKDPEQVELLLNPSRIWWQANVCKISSHDIGERAWAIYAFFEKEMLARIDQLWEDMTAFKSK